MTAKPKLSNQARRASTTHTPRALILKYLGKARLMIIPHLKRPEALAYMGPMKRTLGAALRLRPEAEADRAEEPMRLLLRPNADPNQGIPLTADYNRGE